MKPFKTILVGCGSISDTWLKPTVDHPTINYVGLVDLDVGLARAKRDKFEISSAVTGTDLESVIAETGADLVFDCTVPEAHTAVTVTALENGCHVLGEKPLAVSMIQAQLMVDAAAAHNKIYAVMQNRRYLDNIIRLREFLKSGVIGRLTTLNADYYMAPHIGGFRDKMLHPLLLDMAIHSFDQGRFISNTDPVAVYCHEWNPAGSWYHHGASAMAIFEMTEDVVFSYRGSCCAEGLRTPWESTWRAVGTKGSVYWDGEDDFMAEVVVGNEGFLREAEAIPVPAQPPLPRRAHAGMIDDFLDCLQTGRAPQTVASDNIKSLAMVHSAIASAAANQKLPVAY